MSTQNNGGWEWGYNTYSYLPQCYLWCWHQLLFQWGILLCTYSLHSLQHGGESTNREKETGWSNCDLWIDGLSHRLVWQTSEYKYFWWWVYIASYPGSSPCRKVAGEEPGWEARGSLVFQTQLHLTLPGFRTWRLTNLVSCTLLCKSLPLCCCIVTAQHTHYWLLMAYCPDGRCRNHNGSCTLKKLL